MKILLDHNLPRQIARLLPQHEVEVTFNRGWERLVNGDLLVVAEAAGFECLLTGDQRLSYQQNLTGRKISLVVLSTIYWHALSHQGPAIEQALSQVREGGFLRVELERPPLRRRPYPSSEM